MIRINQLKMNIPHGEEQLKKKIQRTLKMGTNQNFSYEIIRQSVDARKKEEKKFVYSINVTVDQEKKILKKVSDKNIMLIEPLDYRFPLHGDRGLKKRPLIVGSGPAGLFCAYMLAEEGYRPLILERGESVRERRNTVEKFWETGILNTESNVQFGEGGAGTFSDGKLNTLVKDPRGLGRRVLEIFVECGAPREILYEQKPHLGTDILVEIVEEMRGKIQAMGGEFLFNSKMTSLLTEAGKVRGVLVNDSQKILSDVIVLAIGHSARDTFFEIHRQGLTMEKKSFAVGLRTEHHQKLINTAMYGEEENKHLGAAPYKLTAQTKSGRGVYTFCMCPGGYVVNASSEEKRLAVNGMSYQKRAGENANSAVIVTVTPEDFPSEHPLAGIEYQRRLEEAAYSAGKGAVPIQLLGDFKDQKISTRLGSVTPAIKGSWVFADLRKILPSYITESFLEAMDAFDKKIPGFSKKDTVLSGVESRTSSPVRILRNLDMESNVKGVYPCGEGAGYAGGITSAAMDGIKTAEAIGKKYRALYN